MLSYQHAFHAGNLADVHKHVLLALTLDYLTRKDKPLSYIETHAGRALYDLDGAEARKTGEAAKGIQAIDGWFAPDHPYRRVQKQITDHYGPSLYAGSPLVARGLLRPTDSMHLAELHPAEHQALRLAMARSAAPTPDSLPNLRIHHQDGLDLAQSLCPPTPRRGLMLIDPSWEVKSDYATLPHRMAQIARSWNVGVLMLWYPVLTDASHSPMIRSLQQLFPEILLSEVAFPPAREGHRMVGSGMAIVNAPWGLADEAKTLETQFATL